MLTFHTDHTNTIRCFFFNTLQKRKTILTTFYTFMCIFCDITGGLFVYGFTFSFIRSAFEPKHRMCQTDFHVEAFHRDEQIKVFCLFF